MAPILPGAAPDRIGPDTLLLNNRTTALVLRLDRLHPLVSGNKWYKLRPYLEQGAQRGLTGVITWGGPWSNHLLATAAAAESQGWKSIGLVRGEAPQHYSPTLQQCAALGMELRFLSREQYRSAALPEDLARTASQWRTIPEGGYGPLGAAGAATMLEGIAADSYTHILAAVGTGTMLAGLSLGAPPGKEVIGVPVLRPPEALAQPIAQLLPPGAPVPGLFTEYTFGGYARTEPRLIRFMNDFYAQTGIPTDRVYTAKLFFAAVEETRPGGRLEGARLLIIHSGGLQGNRSLPEGTLIFPTP